MTRRQGVRITAVIACLVNFLAFLVWWKLWITIGAVIFLLALLAFLMWWREKIIEPDNERIRMAISRASRA
jgi:hypothetical protein